jgi:hypothetical protein
MPETTSVPNRAGHASHAATWEQKIQFPHKIGGIEVKNNKNNKNHGLRIEKGYSAQATECNRAEHLLKRMRQGF